MPIWSPAFFGSAAGSSGYVIEDSVWFDGSNDYLTFDPGSASSTPDLYCISFWAKRSALGGTNVNVIAGGSSGLEDILRYKTDQLEFTINGGGGGEIQTNAVYRDPTAWQHVFVKYDSANGTAGDRMRMFVNGVEVTSFATDSNPSSGLDSNLLDGAIIAVGAYPDGSQNFNGYLAEFIVLDGQDKAVTDFGEYDSNTGIWIPKEFSGSYGSNGFKLNFSNASSLGADTSGNGNNFTVNGSMATSQQVTDSPTNNSDDGIGNYATLNPIATGSGGTFSNGNLTVVPPNLDGEIGTIGLSSGKWYWECTQNANGGEVGVYTASALLTTSGGGQANGVGSFDLNFNGRTHNNPIGGTLATSSDYTQWAFASGDVIGVALDMDAGKIWFHKNGTYLQSGSGTSGNVGNPAAGSNEMMSGITTTVFPMVGDGTGTAANSQTVNFGQTSFSHTPPTGFKKINTANLAEPTVTDPSAYYQTATWTGDGTAIGSGGKTITFGGNSDLVPDLVWVKRRNEARSHQLYNSVWGWGKANYSDLDDATGTISEGVSAVTSDGFTVGNNGGVNESSDTYVAWCFKAGGAGSTNSAGTISTDPTVSVAAHGGFSIVKWTNDSGAGTPTIPHGLSTSLPGGGRPEMIITKADSASYYWMVYHKDLAGATHYLRMGPSNAAATTSEYLNNTTPGTTTFQTKNNNLAAYDGLAISYCFARTPGLIGIGSYTGNASTDGPNIIIDDGASGFRPAFILEKRTDAAGAWYITDVARNTYNPVNLFLMADSNAVDGTGTTSSGAYLDVTANGYKIRGTSSGQEYNRSGTYIYLCFAEQPFSLNNRAR